MRFVLRLTTFLGLLAALVTAMLHRRHGGAAIAPPWCGTPEPDAAENLLQRAERKLPHIPYYAIGCTLDNIAAASGRMTVERFGKSALGRDKFHVVINALDTKSQRRDYSNWQKLRRYALEDPERAQDILAKAGDDVKVPLFIQGGIHGNEYEGVDAAMQVIERRRCHPTGRIPRSTRSSTRRSSSSTRFRTLTDAFSDSGRTGTASTSTATSSRSRSRKSRARSHSSRSGCRRNCSISTAT